MSKAETSWEDAMDTVYEIMLKRWTKKQIIEFFKEHERLLNNDWEQEKKNLVEVVHCEDCVHWKDSGFDALGKCELWNIVFEYDWFCADGAKMDGEVKSDG